MTEGTLIHTDIIAGSDAAHGRSVWAVAWHRRLQPCCPTSGQYGGEPLWWNGSIYAGAQCSTCGSQVTPFMAVEDVTSVAVDRNEALERVSRQVAEDVMDWAVLNQDYLRQELAETLLYAAVAAAEISETVPPPADWDDAPEVWRDWLDDYRIGFGNEGLRRIQLNDDVLSIYDVDPVSLAGCPESPDYVVASVKLGFTDVAVSIG